MNNVYKTDMKKRSKPYKEEECRNILVDLESHGSCQGSDDGTLDPETCVDQVD